MHVLLRTGRMQPVLPGHVRKSDGQNLYRLKVDRTEKGAGSMKKVVLSVVAALALCDVCIRCGYAGKSGEGSGGRAESMGHRVRHRAHDRLRIPRRHAVGPSSVGRGLFRAALQHQLTGSSMPASPAKASSCQHRGCGNRLLRRRAADLRALGLDFGIWEYYYPGGICYGRCASGARRTYNAPRCDHGNVAKKRELLRSLRQGHLYCGIRFGPTFYYSPNFLNTGRRRRIPVGHPNTLRRQHGPFDRAVGWYASGEFGRQWSAPASILRSRGRGYVRLGQRYSSRLQHLGRRPWLHLEGVHARSALLRHQPHRRTIAPPSPVIPARRFWTPIGNQPGWSQSNWCGPRFVAKLSADLTLGSLK